MPGPSPPPPPSARALPQRCLSVRAVAPTPPPSCLATPLLFATAVAATQMPPLGNWSTTSTGEDVVAAAACPWGQVRRGLFSCSFFLFFLYRAMATREVPVMEVTRRDLGEGRPQRWQGHHHNRIIPRIQLGLLGAPAIQGVTLQDQTPFVGKTLCR